MGKSPKPLTIFVTDSAMLEWPEVEELRKKGHTIGDPHDHGIDLNVDLIFGPNCWRMTPALRRYLPQAIEAARKARYPRS